MLRKGRYGVLARKEYELYSSNRQYYLTSTDVLEMSNGFAPWGRKKDVFIKQVEIEELEYAYEVFPYVILNSHRFIVEGIDIQNETIALVTRNPFVQRKMSIEPYGRDEYVVKLPLSEVEIREERISILGFENYTPQLFQVN